MEAASGTSAIDPEDEVGDASPPCNSNSAKEEENTIVEHQAHSTASAIPQEDTAGEEDGDHNRRLWMSRTCTTTSNKNDHTHHHRQDQLQQMKFIKPETSPQGRKTARIPKTVAEEEIRKSWDLSLIVQQLSNTSHHPQINATTILNEAYKLWNLPPKGSAATWITVKQVGATTLNGLYIFTFSNQNTRDRVLESSPWCIANATFVMRKWQPNMQLASLVQERRSTTFPVWVTLVGVPVEYMNAKGLSYIASVLGEPLYMDRATASRSQLASAKVCVEMRLSGQEWETTIDVALGGGNGVVVVVRVFYQWWPCQATSY